MTTMEDMSAIVLEQADRLFQQHVNKEVLSAADRGEWQAALWAAIEDAGLTLAMVPEAAGGVGLAASDGANLIRRAAFHAVPLPLAETMIANRLWTDAGGDPLEGALTLGPTNQTDQLTVAQKGKGWRLNGVARHVPWGLQSTALIFARDGSGTGYLARVPAPTAANLNTRRRNVAYEPRDELRFDDVELAGDDVLIAPAFLVDNGLMPFGAAIRAQQMIGGMERCLDYALTYSRPCSTCWRSPPVTSPPLPPPPTRFPNPNALETIALRLPSRNRDVVRPRARWPRCASRCMARWDLPRSIRCISRAAACGAGATNGARKPIGRR
jgi:acyl-CoA dehydrogenase